ncbi:MAG: MurR/RpiR family transcriptional regulator [Spirochaetia bacterium]|jgi:DNA-binding MurR/RpiR family transcriptional regulator|nr:MurR/RpiR family transcriptional regulator [Spirochaetia bacterium]
MIISCLKKVEDSGPTCSYSERLIQKYILENSKSVIEMSVYELSRVVKVAPSTIVRYMKKMGFSGYRDFRISLHSEYLSTSQQKWNMMPVTSNVFQNVVETNCKSLGNAFKETDIRCLDAAASLLVSARRIVFFGIGTSAIIASDAHDLLLKLGLNCSIDNNLHHQLLTAALMDKDDVAFIISQSGVNKTILKIAEILITRKINSVGICNYEKTPFPKMVTIPICPFVQEEDSFPSRYLFQIPILCIIETLYYMVEERLGTTVNEVLGKTRQIIESESI